MNRNPPAIIIIMLLLISTLTGVAPEANGQDDDREFQTVHLNLKAGDILSPELDHRADKEAEVRRVEANYNDGIIGRQKNGYVDVGRWTSDGLDGAMTLDSGEFTFNLWFQTVQSNYDAQPDWEFYLYHDGEEIARVAMSSGESNQEPYEVTANANIGSPVEAQPGDTFEIYIRFQGFEDIDVFYDNLTLDSGGAANMDSIHILKADSSSAKFYDAWGLNWNSHGKYFCQLDYGGIVNQGDTNTVISEGGEIKGDNGTLYQTIKIKFSDIQKGGGTTVTIIINYGTNISADGWSDGWSKEAGSDGSGGSGSGGDDGFPIAMAGGVGMVLILAIIGAFLFMQKQKVEGDEDEEEEEISQSEADEYGDDEDEDE